MTSRETGIGEKLRERRTALEWSLDKTAQQAGVARMTVIRAEAGQGVSLTNLVKIASALGLRLALIEADEAEAGQE